MTALLPGDRAIALDSAQELTKGRAYQVIAKRSEFTDFGAEVPCVVVTTWPERQAREILVRGGFLHLRAAEGWRAGL